VSILDANGQISAYGLPGSPPALVWINYGTNDYLTSKSTSDLQTAITGCVTSLRAAAPTAAILVAIPFGLQYAGRYPNAAYVAAIRAGMAAYQSSNLNDTKVQLVDFGASLAATIQNGGYINGDGVHPLAPGHALVAPMVASVMIKALRL
jgi:lysophospholipase L1-like esterase